MNIVCGTDECGESMEMFYTVTIKDEMSKTTTKQYIIDSDEYSIIRY